MSEPNTPRSTPPPASTIQTLAADLLAQRARELLEQVAFGGWGPAQKLKTALDVYTEVRSGNMLKDANDPQKCTVANWDEQATDTERSEVQS